jgi:hypothetical protein
MFEIFEANYALDSVEPKGVFGEGLVPDLPGLAQFMVEHHLRMDFIG